MASKCWRHSVLQTLALVYLIFTEITVFNASGVDPDQIRCTVASDLVTTLFAKGPFREG